MQTIYLDISNKGVMPTIYAKQGDVGRKFLCIISDSGLPYEIPADATVSVLYQNLKDTNAGSASEVDVIGNSVEVTLASAITSVSGDGILCLTISYKNGDEISTWNIPYSVDPKPGVQPINPESPIWQKNAVLYTKQNLTESQKEQARKNIDAVKTPTKITKELFFFGEHDDFQAFGSQRIYKIAGQQVWLNSPTDFDFRVRFNIARNIGQVEEYEFTKSDCTIIETVQGRKHWQFFANVSGTPSLVLTVANGIDPVSFESEPYCSFVYPSDLENYSVEFFKLSETEQELNLVTSVNGIQADEYGNVTIETGDGSTQEEVYVLSPGETVENAPKDVKIVIDPNEEAPTYVQTVNGNKPDENGNVNIEVGGGSGSTVEAKLPITLGSFQYYTWEHLPGNTIEEKAKQIARFDVVVYQGDLSSNLSMSGDAYQRDLALYTKALEYNPNLKVFGYITARGFANSVVGSFHVGMTEYRTSPANVDHPIWTKEELAAYINLMAHCGGTKDESAVDEFGNPVLTGGIPLYGVFFDDYDYNFEDDNTHLINQGDWNSIREKHNFLIDYVHSCGMCAMPNSSPMLIFDNEPTPNSIRNPDGIASHMSEDDWFCRESYFLRSDNTFGLNDNHLTEYNERYRDSYKSKCLALTYINAVSDDAKDNEQIASTFAIYQALCQGAAAIALHGATLVTEIPDEFAKYYDRDDTAVYTSGYGFYGLTVNGHNIVASRSINDTAYGQIPNSVALSTCKVTIDGQHIFNNMYPKTEELTYGFASLENDVTKEIEELKSKVEQSSNLYHRASIDDWEKDYAVSDYKNYSFTFENAFGGEDTNSNSSWNAENPYDFKIFLPTLGSWRRVTMDVRNLAGKTVELGFDKCDAYISGSPTTKIPNAMWQIHANCDSNSWLQLATFDVNTLSKSSIDGVERCCVKFTLPSDIKDLSFWTNRGVAEPSGIWVLEAKGTYLVDTSEHKKQKTWFTNYAPSMSSWGALGNWSSYEILHNGDEVTTRYTAKTGCYESGVYLPENKDIFKPGETWELGFKDIRLVRDDNANASHKMVITCNIGTNICPDIYITGKTYSEYKAMKSTTGDDNLIAISRFTVPASHSGGMPSTPLYVWPQGYEGGDDIGLYSLIVEGLYLYKIDERDELFIRGEDLPDTYIAINRVRTDTVDEKLSPDTLYLVDDGSMFATNFRGERIGRGGSGGGAQSDWNAKEGEPGHVLNRTHYKLEEDVELASGNYTSALIPEYGVFGCPVTYHTQWEAPRPEEFIISFDGVEYRGLKPEYVAGLGTLAGNFAMLNAIMGTSFANTGEPFLAYVGEISNAIVFTMDTAPTAHEIKISYYNTVYHKMERVYLPDPPEINLSEFGLPVIPLDGTKVEVELASKEILDKILPFVNNVVKLVFDHGRHSGTAPQTSTAIAMASYHTDEPLYWFACFVDGVRYVIEIICGISADGKGPHIVGYAIKDSQ